MPTQDRARFAEALVAELSGRGCATRAEAVAAVDRLPIDEDCFFRNEPFAGGETQLDFETLRAFDDNDYRFQAVARGRYDGSEPSVAYPLDESVPPETRLHLVFSDKRALSAVRSDPIPVPSMRISRTRVHAVRRETRQGQVTFYRWLESLPLHHSGTVEPASPGTASINLFDTQNPLQPIAKGSSTAMPASGSGQADAVVA